MNDVISDSEEEILVYAEFEDSVDIDKYRSLHILGVNSTKPIIQMDETFFIGKYENSLGTYMFFEEDPSPQSRDPLFEKLPNKCLKYICKTRKLLALENAYVNPKEGKDDHQKQMNVVENDVVPVAFESIEEATQAFKSYFTTEKNDEIQN